MATFDRSLERYTWSRETDDTNSDDLPMAIAQVPAMDASTPKFQGKGKNIILYGVPGCGKSTAIKEKINKLSDDSNFDHRNLNPNHFSRVVFHPDYTYSDFVGQILPKVENDTVKYEFKPGPFTKILKSAIKKKDEPFFLIIEEINRGNAAAIFGDLFQLLDRKKYRSVYEVDNHDIWKVIHDNTDDNVTNDTNSVDTTVGENVQNDNDVDGNDKDSVDDVDKIYIPENLWLFATMNTSDQNVFTLDTAFQRRWEMELILNVFGTDQEFIIQDTDVTWGKFAKTVNKKLEEGNEMMSGDKRLGAWFIERDEGKDFVSRERFANKVLKYLWDDAFKFNRDAFFKTEVYKTLERVIETFKKHGFGDLFNNISFDSEE